MESATILTPPNTNLDMPLWFKWSCYAENCNVHCVFSKTCLKWSISKRPQIVFNTNYGLMQVKSIAEGSNGSILQNI